MPDPARPAVLRFDDGGWTEAVGGHVALDLVNTVSWRLDDARATERLPDGAALARWARWVGVLDGARAEAFARELAADERRPSAHAGCWRRSAVPPSPP